MRVRWLGWAAVEVVEGDTRVLIDPLITPEGVFAAAGERAAGAVMPELVDPGEGPPAAAALVTHLHRDHADAEALGRGLGSRGRVSIPRYFPGADQLADAGIAQSRAELASAGLPVAEVDPWQRFEVGPLAITALPAVDGTGDPQLSWAIEAGGRRILHCGDTAFHGLWWRLARFAGPFDAVFLPINGAVVRFPWRQPPSPLPAVMTADQAVVAARALGAAVTVPIHFGGFDLEPFYRSDPDALERFEAAAAADDLAARTLELGESVEVEDLAGRPAARGA